MQRSVWQREGRLEAFDFRPATFDHRLRTRDFGLATSDVESRLPGVGSRGSEVGCRRHCGLRCAVFFEVLLQCLGGNPQQIGGLGKEVGAEHGGGAGGEGFEDGAEDARNGVDGVGVGLGLAEELNLKGGERNGVGDGGLEGGGAVTADEGVGVLAGGEVEDAHGKAGGEEHGAGLEGGFLAGGVGVVGDEDGVGVAFEGFDVLGCEGGALGGDGGFEPGGVAADDVDLALA